MNTYIEAQIINMTSMVNTFEASCKMVAMKSDGSIDKTEEKQLKKINAACRKFLKELDAIR